MLRQIQASIKPTLTLIQYLFLVLFFMLSTNPALANHWKNIAPGIEYQDVSQPPLTPWTHVHAFRIDLKQHPMTLVTARELSQLHASAETFAKHSQALIAINGGFFDQKYRPLGLRIYQQHLHNSIKNISWWGIFLIKNQTPDIISSREYRPDKDISFAIQSGPRLIINGTIPHLKPGIAERSALGITKLNKVIILVTENTLLTTTDLAHILQSPPLNCVQAINLDGGSSSQLYASIGLFHINVHGFSNVSDAIVIK